MKNTYAKPENQVKSNLEIATELFSKLSPTDQQKIIERVKNLVLKNDSAK